jgi:hypothetical protein
MGSVPWKHVVRHSRSTKSADLVQKIPPHLTGAAGSREMFQGTVGKVPQAAFCLRRIATSAPKPPSSSHAPAGSGTAVTVMPATLKSSSR